MKQLLMALCALAMADVANAAWSYYAAGAEGNPTTVACISDGNWVLPATIDKTTGKISLSDGWLEKKVKAGSGVCDLRGVLFTLDGVDCRVVRLGHFYFYRSADITEFYADSIETIGNGPFASCSNLTRIELGGTATAVANSGWDYNGFAASCPKLTSVKLDLPLEFIGTCAFYNDPALAVDIANVCPDTVRSVGRRCFDTCRNLTGHLKLIDVTSLGAQAFFRCAGLQEITLTSPYLTATPPTESANCGLFMGCSSVTNITMNCPNLGNVGSGLFRELLNLSGDIAAVCPPSVTNIGGCAYIFCARFQGKLSLPNLNSIGGMAFARVSGIKDIFISGSITNFPSYDVTYNQSVFSSCGVTNVVIEAPGLTDLGNGTFNASPVKTLTVNSKEVVTVGLVAGATSSPKYEAVTILGPAWTQTSLDNLLVRVQAVDGAKTCTLYVDPLQGWDPLLSTEYTEAELAAKPRRCLGVYVTAAGERKAWVCEIPVRRGLVIRIR